jgi:hypothetical protein
MDIDRDSKSPWSELTPSANQPAKKLTVRLDAERYAMLQAKARDEGLSPTTMARVLVVRGLRDEEDKWE